MVCLRPKFLHKALHARADAIHDDGGRSGERSVQEPTSGASSQAAWVPPAVTVSPNRDGEGRPWDLYQDHARSASSQRRRGPNCQTGYRPSMPGPVAPMTLLDVDGATWVYLEGAVTGRMVSDPDEVVEYLERFDLLRAQATSLSQTVRMFDARLEAL